MTGPSPSSTAEHWLELENCSKTFGDRKALSGVDLALRSGEVHALLGQNGCGKSTLIKVLSGYHRPDSGTRLRIAGDEVGFPVTFEVVAASGIAFVHQDLALAPELSVLENLAVGRYDTGAGSRISWKRERARARALFRRFDVDIDLRASAESLSKADQALVAICRALADLERSPHGAGGMLVLDEPTAYLPHDSVESLLSLMRQVADQGVALLFVTHRLGEAVQVADRVTVLRNGEVVAAEGMGTLDEAALVERILGFDLDDLYPPEHTPASAPVFEAVEAEGAMLKSTSFTLHESEVLGVTGLRGDGWEELCYVCFGGARGAKGELKVHGVSHDLSRLSPATAIRSGVALIPADRLGRSGVGEATVTENVTLPTLRQFVSNTVLSSRRERRFASEMIDRFDVQPDDPRRLLRELSGGNQQKALIAKWFAMNPQVFLMHEPTQGVDIGAKQRIFAEIGAAAESGMSLILASAEYEDLAHLCDRVLVLRHGSVAAELHGPTLTHDRILAECFGA